MLKVVVFVSGAVLMALELVGSRVLAPYFGSSIFVWGALISVFLGALSLGYYLGGLMSDRRPDFRVLALMMVISGVMVALLPYFSQPVNETITGMNLGPRSGPLIASITLFFLPGVFLGTVSPYAIKLATRSVSTVGNTAGVLYSISTVGSIFGTLFTSFFLIPAMGVRNIIHALGAVLIVSGGLLLARGTGMGRPRAFLGLIALLALAFFLGGSCLISAQGGSSEFTRVVFEKDSMYHHIVVVEDRVTRYLKFDRSWQSGMYLDDPYKTRFEYTDYLHLGLIFKDNARNALFIGLGGGTAPKRFRRDYPELEIEVAEIDPEVVKVAEKYFFVKQDERLKIFAEDGRMYVNRAKGRYDYVVLDAYYADSIPFHLTTVEFYRLLRSKMSQDGVLVSNIIGALSGRDSRLLRSMVNTLKDVFRQVYIFPVGGPHDLSDTALRNVIVVCTMEGSRMKKGDILRKAKELQAGGQVTVDMTRMAGQLVEEELPLDDVQVLTDDYAPVDALLPI
ncbi:MAG TPA: fused MFS/spermidine synthase [Firmicutes bacterium]|nr:fused MFS/spermidine synthase [Bacillota bacterium]